MRYLKTKFLFVCILVNVCHAQIPSIEWKKCYGGTKSDALQSIRATTDGGYIMAGTTYSSDGDVTSNHGGANDTDIWIVKTDNAGAIEWQKSYGGTQMDFGSDIELTADGGYVICGRTYSATGDSTFNHGAIDAWVIKIAADGTIQWQKTYGSSGADNATHISQTQDGGFIFCGFAGANGGDLTNFHGSRDVWVVKIDATGTLQWQKALGGTNEDYAYKVIPVGDGYVIGCETLSLNGDVTTSHGFTDLWVIKLSPSGAMVWNNCYGSSGREELNDLIATPDGGFIIAGNASVNGGDVSGFHNPGTGNFGVKDDYWVVKLNNVGAIEWQKCYGGSDNDVATKIANTAEGGYIITGYSDSNNGDNNSFFTFNGLDYWVVKTNNLGTIQWQETYGGSLVDSATDLIVTSDGGYVLAGFVNSTDQQVVGNHGNNDFFVVKLMPDVLSTVAFDYDSVQVYPNPATSVLNISGDFDLKSATIYNAIGQQVKTSNLKSIDIANLPQGSYFAKIETGTTTETIKFLKN